MSSKTRPIVVAALVVTDDRGRVLTVRKRGTFRFMLPGGKFEAHESTDQPWVTARREFQEELGVLLDEAHLAEWGIASAVAANEAGHEVVGHHVRYTGPALDPDSLAPLAEIAELRWVDPWLPTGTLAPMLAEYTLPRLREELSTVSDLSEEFSTRPAPERTLGSVTVFCGSGFGKDPLWKETALALGAELGRHRVELVYGGASIGLMGTVADSALAAGSDVVGVIPEVLVNKEISHSGLTRLEQVADMPARKSRMYELGDAFVAMPGGAGTLEEFFEVWTQQHLGIHAKPVALLGPRGFWKPLIELIEAVTEAGFIRRELLDALIHVENVRDVVPALVQWRSGRTKF